MLSFTAIDYHKVNGQTIKNINLYRLSGIYYKIIQLYFHECNLLIMLSACAVSYLVYVKNTRYFLINSWHHFVGIIFVYVIVFR